jgi:hypothetical protein
MKEYWLKVWCDRWSWIWTPKSMCLHFMVTFWLNYYRRTLPIIAPSYSPCNIQLYHFFYSLLIQAFAHCVFKKSTPFLKLILHGKFVITFLLLDYPVVLAWTPHVGLVLAWISHVELLLAWISHVGLVLAWTPHVELVLAWIQYNELVDWPGSHMLNLSWPGSYTLN